MKTKIKFTQEELKWIERTADIETARLFSDYNRILGNFDKIKDLDKTLLEKQITELIELYTFLKSLRTKLELWDCRYGIDSEIELQEKEDGK